jgi:hypothetical protein
MRFVRLGLVVLVTLAGLGLLVAGAFVPSSWPKDQASVDVTYGGEFSVDGGPTIPIPGTVTIPGPEVAVEVLEAHAQLVADP